MKAMLAVAGSVLLFLQCSDSQAQKASAAGAPPPAAAPANVDACALLSKTEMEAIAGVPMAEGARPPAVPPASDDVTFSMCSWTTAESPA